MNDISIKQTNENRIIIFDTTLRDGDQSPGYAMTISEKLHMARRLAAMKVDVIEAGFPISSSLDFSAVKRVAEEIEGPRIAALARASKGDIDCAADALKNCARPRIHTFIATSAEHMKYKLRMSPSRVLEKIQESVSRARSHMNGHGDVEWSAEDATRSSLNFLCQAVRVAIDAGATTINLPDTVGYSDPEEYRGIFQHVIREVNPASHIVFSAHTHSDLDDLKANALAAIHGGARQVECTITGVGERSGNAKLEPVVTSFYVRPDRNPFWCGIDRKMMRGTAILHGSFFENPPSRWPVVGDNSFIHGAGIHQGGEEQKSGCYTIVNPCDYGHEGSIFALTRHSGTAGVNAVLKEEGVFLDEGEQREFTLHFKEQASNMLERYRLRIIPPETVAVWARQWQQGRIANHVIA